MEKKYFIPVVNHIYTNRNGSQYRCTDRIKGIRPWETIAYFTRLSDGWSLPPMALSSMRMGRLNGTTPLAGIGRSKRKRREIS